MNLRVESVSPTFTNQFNFCLASNASVQKSDPRKQKNQENFNQKPAKVKKKRRTIEEENDDLEIETNFTRSSDGDKRKKKVISPKKLVDYFIKKLFKT